MRIAVSGRRQEVATPAKQCGGLHRIANVHWMWLSPQFDSQFMTNVNIDIGREAEAVAELIGIGGGAQPKPQI